MPNFARRLKREARGQFIARSLGALVIGFLSWSGLLILLDLYDAFSPIQETEISSWMVGALIFSSLLFLGLFLYTWIKRPNSTDLARTVESANPELGDLLNTAIEIEGRSEEPKFMERRVSLISEPSPWTGVRVCDLPSDFGTFYSLVLWEEF
jgi:uncharacterized protein (DUF58 family)